MRLTKDHEAMLKPYLPSWKDPTYFEDVLRIALERLTKKDVKVNEVMKKKAWPRLVRNGSKEKGALRLHLESALTDEPQTIDQLIEGTKWERQSASPTLRRMRDDGDAHHCGVLPGNQYLWKAGKGENVNHYSWNHIVLDAVTSEWRTSKQVLTQAQKIRPETTIYQIKSRLTALHTEGKIERQKKAVGNFETLVWKLP